MRHTEKPQQNKRDNKVASGKPTNKARHTRLPGPKLKVFNEQTKSYEDFTANRWPVENEIRWIEERLREREVYEDKNRTEDEKRYLLAFPEGRWEEIKGLAAANDFRIWLAKVRDEKSWNEIAQRDQPDSFKIAPEAIRSSVRRAYERVERYLVAK